MLVKHMKAQKNGIITGNTTSPGKVCNVLSDMRTQSSTSLARARYLFGPGGRFERLAAVELATVGGQSLVPRLLFEAPILTARCAHVCGTLPAVCGGDRSCLRGGN